MTDEFPTAEFDMWLRTSQGHEAYVKVAGVDLNTVLGLVHTMSEEAAAFNMTPAHRWSSIGAPRPTTPTAGTSSTEAQQTAQAPQPTVGPAPACANCGEGVWDNRLNKRSDKAPDFKCKSQSCGAAAWIQKDDSLKWVMPKL